MAQPPKAWQGKASNLSTSFSIEPKEEPIDIHEYLFQDYQISASELMSDEKTIKDEEMDNVNSFPIEPKQEPIDIHEPLPQYYQISASELMRDEKMFKEEEMDNENTEGITANAQNSGIHDLFANAPPHNDHNYARILKRRSSGDEESESASKKLRGTKRNDSVLECPECDFRTRSVNGWVCHLRNMHYTSLTLAGLALLCECGNESVSVAHSRKCDGNITVIRKKDGPIKRFGDARPTPQCVLCEAFPKSVRGYTHHLNIHHKSTLAQNGVYLICSCGLEVRNNNPGLNHLKDCNRRQFTLHNVDEEATPQCVLCEIYPKTACGYAAHLDRHHKSTLKQNGIYLMCSCGLEIRCDHRYHKHPEGCNPREFTLHKLGDE